MALPTLSRVSGGRDLWSPPLQRPPRDPEAAVWKVLGEVLDPEIPVSVVDLGLVYAVAVNGGTARIRLTFTATACPCMDFIREDVRDRLLQETWLGEVVIEEVWDPPWSTDRLSPEARGKLKRLGIAT